MKTDKVVDYKKLVFAFVNYNRRLYGFEALSAPEEIINKEKNKIQAVYNKMRESCLGDMEYIEQFEKDIKTDSRTLPPNTENNGFENNDSLVPA